MNEHIQLSSLLDDSSARQRPSEPTEMDAFVLAKARLRVKLNGVEGTLHRPHHGDALGRQDILHIREYLAHARATPSQYEAIRKGAP